MAVDVVGGNAKRLGHQQVMSGNVVVQSAAYLVLTAKKNYQSNNSDPCV